VFLSLFAVFHAQLFPRWQQTWNLAKSTIIQHPYDYANMPTKEVADADARFGLVLIDWGIDVYQNMTFQESKMETYAATLKSIGGPLTRVFEYRNTMLGLSMFATQRAVMYDPVHSAFWVVCGNGLCNDPAVFPTFQQDQYFWDYRNPEARDYFIRNSCGAIETKPVDGIWFDDQAGFAQGHDKLQSQFTLREIVDLRAGSASVLNLAQTYLWGIGKYSFNSFTMLAPPQQDSNCAYDVMAAAVVAAKQPIVMLSKNLDANLAQHLAAFLLVRQEYAYFGAASQPKPYWYPEFDRDYGIPSGDMSQVSAGVFTRALSKVQVTLNCNTWKATFDWKPAVMSQMQ